MNDDIKKLSAIILVIAIVNLFSAGHLVGGIVLIIFAFLLGEGW